MEDSPKINGEDNTEKDIERDDDSTASRSPQDFLARWRRFTSKDAELQSGMSSFDKPKELDDDSKEKKKNDNEDDEEEDDDDDETEHLSSPIKSRMRRLRRHLKPFLPQTKELKEGDTEKSELPLIEDIETTGVDSSPSGDTESLPGYNPSAEIQSAEIFNDSEANITDKSNTQNPNVREESSTIEVQETSDSGHNNELIPETESIEDILIRREQEVEQAQQRNEILRATTGDVISASLPLNSEEVKATSPAPEVVQHNAPIGGLLAVDLLNYRIAKKRDQKNKVQNERQHNQLRSDQKRDAEAATRRIDTLELQQNRQQSVIERSVKEPSHQIRPTSNEVIYNRNAQMKEVVDTKKPEHISVAPVEAAKPNLETIGNSDRSPQTATTFENTLQRVHEAEKGKISSEFQFERRHEVMDEPGGSRDHAPNMTGPYEYDPASMKQSSSTTKSSGQDYGVGGGKQSDESRQPVYKQAAVTGFWGAVVGIIVFIIMYMLASK
ncbi:MAG: hypothetical protein QG628_529 [Patescibacteria group bacterium]|nr:hypothetical protein [Patescibacteria group bacterium]